MVFGGFFALALRKMTPTSKEWILTSFMTFLTNKKEKKIFFSNFRQRNEHDVSRKPIIFLNISASAGTVGSPIQINVISWHYQFEKSD